MKRCSTIFLACALTTLALAPCALALQDVCFGTGVRPILLVPGFQGSPLYDSRRKYDVEWPDVDAFFQQYSFDDEECAPCCPQSHGSMSLRSLFFIADILHESSAASCSSLLSLILCMCRATDLDLPMQWQQGVNGTAPTQAKSPVGPERKDNDAYPTLDGFIGDLFELTVWVFWLITCFVHPLVDVGNAPTQCKT